MQPQLDRSACKAQDPSFTKARVDRAEGEIVLSIEIGLHPNMQSGLRRSAKPDLKTGKQSPSSWVNCSDNTKHSVFFSKCL